MDVAKWIAKGKDEHAKKRYVPAITAFTKGLEQMQRFEFQCRSKYDANIETNIRDHRIEAYVKNRQLDLAMKDAKHMIRLKRDGARGYLRCGQLARRQDQYYEAIKWYEQGMINVPPHDQLRTELVSQLEKAKSAWKQKTAKLRDPMSAFPPEVLESILSYLPYKSLFTFLRVSKSWCHALTTNGPLREAIDLSWIELHGITPASFRALVRRLPRPPTTVRVPMLAERIGMKVSQYLWDWLRGHHLRHLEIDDTSDGCAEDNGYPADGLPMSRLILDLHTARLFSSLLSLKICRGWLPQSFLPWVLEDCQSLHTLELEFGCLEDPRTLRARLQRVTTNNTSPPDSRALSSVQDLWPDPDRVYFWTANAKSSNNRLRRLKLTFTSHVDSDDEAIYVDVEDLLQLRDLEYLELENVDVHNERTASMQNVSADDGFPNLRKLRLHRAMWKFEPFPRHLQIFQTWRWAQVVPQTQLNLPRIQQFIWGEDQFDESVVFDRNVAAPPLFFILDDTHLHDDLPSQLKKLQFCIPVSLEPPPCDFKLFLNKKGCCLKNLQHLSLYCKEIHDDCGGLLAQHAPQLTSLELIEARKISGVFLGDLLRVSTCKIKRIRFVDVHELAHDALEWARGRGIKIILDNPSRLTYGRVVRYGD